MSLLGPTLARRSQDGHGAGADDAKETLLRYFREVDKGLRELFKDEQAPLVLVGVDYLHPIYKEANTYPRLVSEGIVGNPEALSPDELHEKAWAVVHPLFKKARTEAAERFAAFVGSGSRLASNNLEDIVPTAYHGRVESLFVAVGVQRWGRFDPTTNQLQLREEPEPGDEDLLDFAAIHTFHKGGTAVALEPEKMPDGGVLAAIFRY